MIKLEPALKERIWGGDKLSKFYNKRKEGDNIAESWEVSVHPDGLTRISGTELYLCDAVNKNDYEGYDEFPVLVKLIDAADKLSVQVHPDDAYAEINEHGAKGKSEMWYVTDADEGAGLYVGFKEKISSEQFASSVADGTVMSLLNFFSVKKGDVFFIPAGTVHAIGQGVTLCEIQENSNLTYRVYDFKRKDKNGRERELAVDKALKVANLDAYVKREKGADGLLGSCEYFCVYERHGDTTVGSADSFTAITVTDGKFAFGDIVLLKGDSAYMHANEFCEIKGCGTFIETVSGKADIVTA